MNIELQKLFLDSPFDMEDFSEEELHKIETTKQINQPKQLTLKLNIKKLKQNVG